jgi:alcohol dehydrogenase
MGNELRSVFEFHSAGRIIFGRNAIKQLPQALVPLNVKRVLVITDPILVRIGMLETVLEPLTKAGYDLGLFDGGEPEPTQAMVEKAIDFGRQFVPDAVLGLGGGSNIDCAKLVANVLSHHGGLHDYVGENRIPGPVLPIVAVPTTSGTGSEVSAAAVFTDTTRHIKVSTLSQYLRPRLALVDPVLSQTCPPKVTADAGIDALVHAIEAFTAIDNEHYPLPTGETSVYQGKNPFADLYAEKTIQLVGRYLKRAVQDGSDLEAREGMSLAATMGGLAFSNAGVALVHAMEYPVGGAVHVSHGAGNGLLLPYVMQYNEMTRMTEFARIAQLLGADTSKLTLEGASQKAIEMIIKLRKDIGIPNQLRELGVKPEQLKGFAEKAISIQRLMRVNPRYPSMEEILHIYEQAF